LGISSYERFEYLLDIKKRDIARAFNPFLVAKSDKLKKLIEEVQQQIEGYEAYHQLGKEPVGYQIRRPTSG
jgi:predicted RND superfamily exporter protein